MRHDMLCHVLKFWEILLCNPTLRTLDRRLQKDWGKDAREDPRILMSLRVDFGPMD